MSNNDLGLRPCAVIKGVKVSGTAGYPTIYTSLSGVPRFLMTDLSAKEQGGLYLSFGSRYGEGLSVDIPDMHLDPAQTCALACEALTAVLTSGDLQQRQMLLAQIWQTLKEHRYGKR